MSDLIGPFNLESQVRPCRYAPGHKIAPDAARLSLSKSRATDCLVPVRLLEQRGNSYQICVAGAGPEWVWSHNERHIRTVFQRYRAGGVAYYDAELNLIVVTGGTRESLLNPLFSPRGCNHLPDMLSSGDCITSWPAPILDAPGVCQDR
ncbi:hypothetical protein WG915_10175 [Corynebacterium sp. H128]|uniref:hypothetical protein n=1 Tax=unclassified Corynebacterium TaxID=2624378 RepID=UPI0030B36EA4